LDLGRLPCLFGPAGKPLANKIFPSPVRDGGKARPGKPCPFFVRGSIFSHTEKILNHPPSWSCPRLERTGPKVVDGLPGVVFCETIQVRPAWGPKVPPIPIVIPVTSPGKNGNHPWWEKLGTSGLVPNRLYSRSRDFEQFSRNSKTVTDSFGPFFVTGCVKFHRSNTGSFKKKTKMGFRVSLTVGGRSP